MLLIVFFFFPSVHLGSGVQPSLRHEAMSHPDSRQNAVQDGLVRPPRQTDLRGNERDRPSLWRLSPCRPKWR